MRTWVVVFALVLVAGLSVVSYGFTQPDSPETLYVDEVDASTVEDEELFVVTYENLSEGDQALFDRARTSNGQVSYPPGEWSSSADVVRYDGQYYEVSRSISEGTRIVYFLIGWPIAGVGAAGLGVLCLLRWWREGSFPLRPGSAGADDRAPADGDGADPAQVEGGRLRGVVGRLAAMRWETLVFGLLVVLGLTIVGYGHVQTSEERLTVEPVREGQIASEEVVVAYEELSDREQTLFDRARDGGGTVTYPSARWTTRADAIRDGNQYFELTRSWHERPRSPYYAAGFGLVTVAIVGFSGVRGFRHLRGTE